MLLYLKYFLTFNNIYIIIYKERKNTKRKKASWAAAIVIISGSLLKATSRIRRGIIGNFVVLTIRIILTMVGLRRSLILMIFIIGISSMKMKKILCGQISPICERERTSTLFVSFGVSIFFLSRKDKNGKNSTNLL